MKTRVARPCCSKETFANEVEARRKLDKMIQLGLRSVLPIDVERCQNGWHLRFPTSDAGPSAKQRRRTPAQIRKLRADEPIPAMEPKRYKNSQGYVRLRWLIAPNTYVEEYEHRVVMERPAGEVHHKNGIKSDNRPENLIALTKEEHALLHADRVRGQGKYAPYRSKSATDQAQRAEQRRQANRARAREMAKLYKGGATTIEIGQQFGVHSSTVSRTLRETGVLMRPRNAGANDIPGRARQIVKARAHLRCERCGTSVKYEPSNVHHRNPRGMGGSSNPEIHATANLLLLCIACHGWTESHRAEAYRLGYLVETGIDPLDKPVLLAGRLWAYPSPDGKWVISGEVAS